jgi:hypothetical protein
MVIAMRSGETICVNLENHSVDFTQWPEFPASQMFDYQQSRQNYLVIVHPEEKFDRFSKVVDGTFSMGKEFMVVIMSTNQDDDSIATVLKGLPHEKMHKFIIE